MQVIRFLLGAMLALCLSVSMAQVQYAKGKASISYTTWKLNAEDKTKALRTAQLKAIESYYAEAGESEAANFEAIRAQVTADPEAFLTDTTVLSEEDKSDAKQYSVAVRVSLNVAKLNNTIKAGSAVARAGKARSPSSPSCSSRARSTRRSRSTPAFTSAKTPRWPSRPNRRAPRRHAMARTSAVVRWGPPVRVTRVRPSR